ncbi:MAG: DMT family transporter [Burkholderiales bacterium]|nr:DMT family transporter [Burkholderiales bacterium]
MNALASRLWSSAWILLFLVNLFWAGNIIVGRAVAGRVPPVALAYWRWTGAFLLAFAFAWPHLKRDWPVLLRHWRMMLLLSFVGIASYNTMCYIGLQYTTALNVLLLQSVIPVVILLWAFALFGERPGAAQALGVTVSLCGVAAIASGGSLETLLQLSVNRGDVWVFSAILLNSAYAPLLRLRPAVHPMSFLVAAMGIGSLMMLPVYLWELAAGGIVRGGWTSYAAMAYTAVLPSFVAYLFFNRGVELIGAARAGQSVHLMPVIGSVIAVLLLGERFHGFHFVGMLLIGAGIVLASRRPST